MDDNVNGFFVPMVPTVVNVDLYMIPHRHPEDVKLYLMDHIRITAVLPDKICIEHLGSEENKHNFHALVPAKHVINGTSQLQIDIGSYRFSVRTPSDPIRFGSPLDGYLLPEVLFDPDPMRGFVKVGDEGGNEVYSKMGFLGDWPVETRAYVDSQTGLLVALSEFTSYPREATEYHRLVFSNWIVRAEISDDLFRTDVPVGVVSEDVLKDMILRAKESGVKSALRSASITQIIREMISRLMHFRKK